MFRAATLWRRISPFSLFMMDQRRNPSLAGLPIVQRGKLLSQMYKTLPLDKRANLERRAEAHPSFATASSPSLPKSRTLQGKSGTKRRLAPRNHNKNKWKAQGRKEQKVPQKILLKSTKNKKGSRIEPPTSNRKTTTTTTSLKGSTDKKRLKKTLTFQQYAKRHIGKVSALHDSKRMTALSKMFQLKKPVVIQGAHGKRMIVEPCQTLEVTVKERLKKYEARSSRPSANASVHRASAPGGLLTRSKTNKGSAIQWSSRSTTPFSPSSTARGFTVGRKSSTRRPQGLGLAKAKLPRKRSVGVVKRITAVPPPASPRSPSPTTRGQAIWLMKKMHPQKTKDKAAGTVTGKGSSAKGSLVKAKAKASLPRASSNPGHHSGSTNTSVISTKQVQQLLDRAVRLRPPASPSPASLSSLGHTAGNKKKGSNPSSLRRTWFTSNARSEKRSGNKNKNKSSTMFPQIMSALPRERTTTNNRKTSLQNVSSAKGIKAIRVSPRGTFSPQRRQQASLRQRPSFQSKSASTTSPFSTPIVSSARSTKIKATNRRLKNPFDILS